MCSDSSTYPPHPTPASPAFKTAAISIANSTLAVLNRGGKATLRILVRNEGILMLSMCAGALVHLGASIYGDERHEELHRRTTLIRYHQKRSDMSADKMARLMVRVPSQQSYTCKPVDDGRSCGSISGIQKPELSLAVCRCGGRCRNAKNNMHSHVAAWTSGFIMWLWVRAWVSAVLNRESVILGSTMWIASGIPEKNTTRIQYQMTMFALGPFGP